ncbi:MAG: elongation factor G [Rhodobacteraceae bacterium]|nr:elongation factor G [Paracoccaceae bacterium]
MAVSQPRSSRAALICGPYLSGKTSLLEALLAEAEALQRHSSPNSAFSLGDGSPEAKAHGMSTELNVATADYLGERWTFIDCPGSVDLMQETRSAMSVVDIAVVVVEPTPDKAITLSSYLKLLDEYSVPVIIFINKFDKKDVSAKALMEAFQGASSKPLVLREIPIRDGETVTGHVDLVSERAFHWEENKPSSQISLPDEVQDRETAARTELFESLADFDDDLLEKLLEDEEPTSKEIYANLSKDLSTNLVVPVFFGSATHGNGIRRLMKALRHEGPGVDATADRLGLEDASGAQAKVFKTLHVGHAGKLSLARVLRGSFATGDTLNGERPSGINLLFGQKLEPVSQVNAGDIVAFTKLDSLRTGDLATAQGKTSDDGLSVPPTPLYGLSIRAENRSDDVKLSDNLKKVLEEDTSLSCVFDDLTGEMVLRGQGDMHLKLCLEKLKNRTGLTVHSAVPKVAYRETARRKAEKRVRHRKQSGGHGEFGEVQLKIAPLPRGTGFQFNDAIHGGVVPRQYIPAVKHGVEDAITEGPMGYPVVDVDVTLDDGKHHSVDSSELAFRKAGGQAMREALKDAKPVILEPLNQVTITVPSEFIARIQKIILGRRGQIYGFEAKDGWIGWDEVSCQIPAAEMQDLVVEIRSATMGVGTFTSEFDHLQEISEKEHSRLTAHLEEETV